MRYIVVQVTTEPVDPGGSFSGSVDEEDSQVPDVREVVLCEDARGVASAIKEAESGCLDWAVFEVTGGRTVRRSVARTRTGLCTIS